ncbi:MAG: beta-galactosidase trimerization domain-containing protein [Oscillospiraceae bacterium]|nr:beta-galactosidase trimerization domain-containing protein [Oscillospiraceae bacterium]
MQKNLWDANLSWFWLNDEQIFKYTQEDFDRQAQMMKDNGVTDVENFGITHFRFTFYPYWKEIIEAIRKVVVACHKVGLRVHEHASAHLTFAFLSPNGWKQFENMRATYSSGGPVSYDTWKKIFPFLTTDFMIEGKDIRTFLQIDGATGKPVVNRYGAYALCFNNPDYREVYFNHMKDICKTGIDGIMNDDIQFFGENACACEHCRKKFFEKTGYTLPSPENWDKFINNYDDPVFVAWKMFKFESTAEMYRDLTRLYESEGVSLMRWNYASTVLRENNSFYSFDRCLDMWDVIMQENCFSSVMKESYPDYFAESVHRFAAAERRGVPSMSLFYPDRPDNVYFAWALARSWGQMYTGTHEGHDISDLEKPYRDFEKKYFDYYKMPKKHRDLSFYFSLKTRDCIEDSHEYSYRLMAGIQGAYFSNLGVDLVMENDSVEELCRHKLIVAPDVLVLDDAEIANLGEYVKKGGTLFISGEFATKRSDVSKRSEKELSEALGVAVSKDSVTEFGEGRIIHTSKQIPKELFQEWVWAERRQEIPESGKTIPSKRKEQRAFIKEMFSCIVKEPKLSVTCENEDVITTVFKTSGALSIHLMNLKNTVSENEGIVWHTDIIKDFSKDGVKAPEIQLSVKVCDGFVPKTVRIASPEIENELPLSFEASGDTVRICVPEDIFSGYALVIAE